MRDLHFLSVTSLVLVVLLPSLSLSDGGATEMCVIPFDLYPCPCNTSCHTFDYYLNHSEVFFVSNTTFLFLPGVHQVNGLFDGVGVSDLSFIGNNATLLILTETPGSWFSLENSTFVAFSGLSMNANFSLTLISLINVSNVGMTNIKMESNCCDFLSLMKSTGYFHIQNITIALLSINCSVNITQISNVSGLIDISHSKYSYFGAQPCDIVAVDIRCFQFGTVSIVDTEFYGAAVLVLFCDNNRVSASNNNTVFLMDNVLIDSSYGSGLTIQTIYSVSTCNITILNSRITKVNGTALSLRLDSHFRPSAVIRNLELSFNCGMERHEIAFVIIGYQSSYHAIVELHNLAIESNAYFTGATTVIDTVDILMSNCSFSNNAGTALFLLDSTLPCVGHSEFKGNFAFEAAGISIGEGSKIEAISSDAMLIFTNNTANDTGGAIYLRIDPASYVRLINRDVYAWCFVPDYPPAFLFENNVANNGGDNIFGLNFEFASL